MENIASLYNQIKPGREILYFSPCLSQAIFHPAITSQRLLFHSTFLNKFEDEMLKKFESVISERKQKHNKLLTTWHRNELLKFLYNSDWDLHNALKSLEEYLKWRENNIAFDINYLSHDIKQLLEMGCFYIHGRDKQFRPIIILRPDRIDCRKYSVEQYLKAAFFFLEFIIKSMLVAGKVESWILIIDMAKEGLGNIPYGQLKKVIEVFQENYLYRLAYQFILNTPKSMNMIWNILQHFLSKSTRQKTYLSSEPHSSQLLNIVEASQLEAKYGGSCPNLKEFWPPLHMVTQEEESSTGIYDSFDDFCLRTVERNTKHKRMKSSPGKISREAEYYEIVVEEVDSDEYLLENIPSEGERMFIQPRIEFASSSVSNCDKNTSQVEFIASFISSLDRKESDNIAMSGTTSVPKHPADSIILDRGFEIDYLYDELSIEKEPRHVSCFSFKCYTFKREESSASCSLL